MEPRHLFRSALLWLGALCPAARADITSYTVGVTDSGTVLTSVTATRGKGSVVFDATRLIRAKLLHFRAGSTANVATTMGGGAPAPDVRATLLTDLKLNTGLVNPGGSVTPLEASPVLTGPEATPGIAIAFQRPVVNRPGDDVVVFEVQLRGHGANRGDAFHVGPLRFGPGLRSHTVRTFDITLSHAKVQPAGDFELFRFSRVVRSLEELRTLPLGNRGSSECGFEALAVGVDLSDLGYAPGAKVEGLLFQSVSAGGGIDPVLIAGLPTPAPPNVLAAEPKAPEPKFTQGKMLKAFLDGPMKGTDEIVFAGRVSGRDHWYGNFGYYSDRPTRYAFGHGGRLCRLNLRTGKVAVLLDDPKGGVRDPQVHYDARKIIFSYRKGGTVVYHLYEINIDGSGLRQLTDGPDDDIEPTYLPSGDIVFVSSRCRRYVPCWYTRVGTLYRCDADDGKIRMLSSNAEHENTPWILPDGRVLYTRWEYVDRNQLLFHHLWTVNPDGTGTMVYFGNQCPGYVMIDAKPIPGTSKIVASFSPGHGRAEHLGYTSVVSPTTGPDNMRAARRLGRGQFRDPYAFSDDCFLVADAKGLHVMNGQGDTELVYRLPPRDRRMECHEPRPLRPRLREPVIPDRTDLSQPAGRLALYDVYLGRNMKGVKPGEIKELLVLEQLPKPVNFSGGQEPLTIGGTFHLERVLGTVPVEPDGSAYFEARALRSLFFVALDAQGLSVKRMHSFVTVMPGETTSCVGCHEHRVLSPHRKSEPLAMRRPASPIRSVAGIPEVLDYPRDIQPILDRHCVRCHRPERRDGQVDLCGDHTPAYSVSYWSMMKHGLIADGRNTRRGSLPPRAVGTAASRLLKLADGSHYDARITDRDRTILRTWIESGATYPGTYAALGTGMAPVTFPEKTMERRCGPCHGSQPKRRHPTEKGRMFFQFGKRKPPQALLPGISMRYITLVRRLAYYQLGEAGPHQSLCNLTRPALSLLLRAPLAKDAGGLALCTPCVFPDTTDPDYQQILAAISTASKRLSEIKRFDMPNFRASKHYRREMQRFGALPAELPADALIDPYATDRAYWRMFWHRPSAR